MEKRFVLETIQRDSSSFLNCLNAIAASLAALQTLVDRDNREPTDHSDYEAELSIILSKTGRDIPESEAMSYVLGYTCSHDVSARTQQFKNSQWCFSKGLDGSCPLDPVLVSPSAIGDPHSLRIRAIHNGHVVQASNTREMIFGIAKTISFLSQGTTLKRGTVIMTGTGPGIGAMLTPKVVLQDDDDMRVEVENIGTLVNRVYYE
ncbi:hypothetical protein P170DRAFT_511928 [Aspergillus steynii IBT 23096]|uniref:Fumarylacetoacetase-like C-terminal domain-containing protein n=1 Tax=Aspergillus steynii IBT 23096 TaxID=1392250 RepID=A0A2I2G348_9EURO|nr:uncharacterized protein P170DRAFT_511928 [Aspergillus steynii IBT 23096]PLB47301.1 hypothetical protein P170DRAFT_511928 [Aspergillus steynii IBT 23096]